MKEMSQCQTWSTTKFREWTSLSQPWDEQKPVGENYQTRRPRMMKMSKALTFTSKGFVCCSLEMWSSRRQPASELWLWLHSCATSWKIFSIIHRCTPSRFTHDVCSLESLLYSSFMCVGPFILLKQMFYSKVVALLLLVRLPETTYISLDCCWSCRTSVWLRGSLLWIFPSLGLTGPGSVSYTTSQARSQNKNNRKK